MRSVWVSRASSMRGRMPEADGRIPLSCAFDSLIDENLSFLYMSVLRIRTREGFGVKIA